MRARLSLTADADWPGLLALHVVVVVEPAQQDPLADAVHVTAQGVWVHWGEGEVFVWGLDFAELMRRDSAENQNLRGRG